MVQDRPVLLHVQVQLLGEAAAGRSPLQGPQHGWEQLGTGRNRVEGSGLRAGHVTCLE